LISFETNQCFADMYNIYLYRRQIELLYTAI